MNSKMYILTFVLIAVAVVSARVALLAQPCKPGSTTSDYCNTCTCIASGTGYECTTNECPPRAKRTAQGLMITVCNPGDTKMEDCNSCHCNSDGSGWACTRMACPKFQQTCEPNKSFKHYCNTCLCPADGLLENASCTKIGCLDGMWKEDGTRVKREETQIDDTMTECDDSERCDVLGETRKNDCNTCRCEGKPLTWVCTELSCI